MASKDPPEPDGESSNSFSIANNLAAHLSASSPSPSAFGNHFGSMGNGQQHNLSSFLDPNMMMMTNAAATIAAVAASAVQQMNQAKLDPNHNSVQSGLAAAMNARTSMMTHQHHPNPGNGNPAASQLAALLGAAPSASSQNIQNPSAVSLQQFLGLGDKLQTPAPPQVAATPNGMFPNMQTWSLEQLEQHVNLLQQLNQPVPQYLALLLAEARRKHKKKNAKRVANRKSASTSRARKKALVEEMTRTNARLKRQALILSLIPDLVITVSSDGEITFCSAQVERVLKHKPDDLVGAKLSDLLVPASREALSSLVKGLIGAEKGKATGIAEAAAAAADGPMPAKKLHSNVGGRGNKATQGNNNGNANSNGSRSSSGADASAAAIVSEQSFPLSVVEVDSKQSARPSTEITAEQNENSDASMSNSNGKPQTSSLTNSTGSPTLSSGDEKAAGQGGSSASAEDPASGKQPHSSDDSSSSSSDTKNMSKANDNLDRNVRSHNQRMMEGSQKSDDDGPKDDVTGASVTANNATARLSSLKHVPDHSKRKESARYENGDQSSSDDSLLGGVEETKKRRENASDDSGYRESNDSREETSCSGSETSNSNGRIKKSLTPTYRMCLIRSDLTTIWCEVTSSIGTRSVEVESCEIPSTSKSSAPSDDGMPPAKEEIMELLLCLRPIRDGEKKVDESLRFHAINSEREGATSPSGENSGRVVSASSGDPNISGGTSTDQPKRPPKKRGPDDATLQPRKKQKTDAKKNSSDSEKSVVESLMLMNKASQ
eukprot:scaffold1900_cov123-Cylindrotheca_fusiformis.AAC.7